MSMSNYLDYFLYSALEVVKISSLEPLYQLDAHEKMQLLQWEMHALVLPTGTFHL